MTACRIPKKPRPPAQTKNTVATSSPTKSKPRPQLKKNTSPNPHYHFPLTRSSEPVTRTPKTPEVGILPIIKSEALFPRAKIAKIEDFARYVQPPQKPRGDFTTRRNFDAPTRLA